MIPLVLLLALILAGCSASNGNQPNGGRATSDVTNLAVARVEDRLATLSWGNPLDDDVDRIRITYPEATSPIEVDGDARTVDRSTYSQNQVTWQATYEFEFDDCGNVIVEKELPVITSSPESSQRRTVFESNSHHDVTSLKSYSSQGMLEDEIGYLYNPNRTLSERVHHGRTESQYSYDERGNLTSEQYSRLPGEVDSYYYQYDP